MNINKLERNSPLFPEVLRHIPQSPRQLYTSGLALDQLLTRPRVAIVGSRRITTYGKQVTHDIAYALAERGIVIISGLAYGVDSIAHQAALEASGACIAVLPSPLDNIVPVTHQGLARRIVEQGGALLSEYAPGSEVHKGNFVERNRLMSGLADVVVIVEAAMGSGSLHTADFAADQGITVMAVPGNITSPQSAGTNNLIRDGIIPVTSYIDILRELKLDTTRVERTYKGRSVAEQSLLNLLKQGVTDSNSLQLRSGLSASEYQQALVGLEIDGLAYYLGAQQWAIA